jgi:hypothetical protein
MPRLLLPALLALAVLAPAANAGTYDVYGCRMPDGSAAPVSGWTAQGANAHDMCWAGQGLTAELPPQQIYTNVSSGWQFTSPANTVIDNFTIYRYAESESVWPWGRDYASSYDDANPLGLTDRNPDYCLSHFAGCTGAGVAGSVFAADNRVVRGGVNAHSLKYQVLCWNYGNGGITCDPGTRTPGRLVIFAARVGLLDDFAPTFDEKPSGALVSGDAVAGVAAIVVSASDRGGGLARAWLEVDGKRVAERVIDTDAHSCRVPFTDTVPCPLHAKIELTLDTSALGNGPHRLHVGMVDASGNTTSSEDFDVTVANAPAPVSIGDVRIGSSLPNGGNATRFAALKASFAGASRRGDRTVRYGVPTRIEGQLAATSGRPIAGAMLAVEERVAGAAAMGKPLPPVRTDANGRFAYRLVAGPSRAITFSYQAFSLDPGPVAIGQVTVHVRAGVSLRVTPNRVRNGSVITFKGRVRGGRALVTIYALAGGPRKRIPVETVRAGSDGRFRYRYRFRSIPGPSTYRFEARVPAQTGFPYSEGSSPVVVVRGRP